MNEPVKKLIPEAVGIADSGDIAQCDADSQSCQNCRWRLSHPTFLKSATKFLQSCFHEDAGINPCQLKLLKTFAKKMAEMKCSTGPVVDGLKVVRGIKLKIPRAKLLPGNKARIINKDGIEVHLSAREVEVLKLLIEEHAVSKLAELLGISKFTFNQHLRSIYTKLSVNTRAGAVRVGHANKVYGAW